MRVKNEAELLRQVPLFAGADPAHLQIIAFAAPPLEIPAKSELCRAGAEGECAFLILAGTATIRDGAGEDIGTAGPGAFVGERTLLTGEAYAFTLIARDKLQVIRIARPLLLRVAGEFPEFALCLVRTLGARLDDVREDLRALLPLFV